jgi:hypothetical protein
MILEGENNIVHEPWKIGQKAFRPRRMKEREDGRMDKGSISLSGISSGALQTVGSRFVLLSEGNSNLEFALMQEKNEEVIEGNIMNEVLHVRDNTII